MYDLGNDECLSLESLFQEMGIKGRLFITMNQTNRLRHREAVSGCGDLPAMRQTTGRLPLRSPEKRAAHRNDDMNKI
jgi:hypothetical protein